ncbi:MazG family protein [Galbitalea sp. SE-J8]|uniref:MazG family protein n=1 Tax=Galbitalea sp. SE-J8 TaxID=3054952 RepID=UPI00259CC425|nr:MazG family protein [Galbitalea sp. SE-J8]MDM4762777.1 MazG family protein [Galbitalea sp. SE-J8]
MSEHPRLDELVATLERLRAPGGCAWDAEQTHASLVRYLVEETYELVDAIESGGRDDLLEELGDVLYQVLFHADIAAHTAEEGFTIEDVAERMTAKMVGRHPHVFGTVDAGTADAVVALWDRVKAVEKPERTSVLDGIPAGMPALALADKVVGRAEKVGAEPVAADVPGTEEELGALLMGLVVGARAKGLDPERAMRAAVRALSDDIRSREAADASSRSE